MTTEDASPPVADQSPAPTPEETYHSAEWIYQGQRIDGKGKPYHVWQDEAGKAMWYAKNLVSGTSGVGSVYVMTITEKGSFFTSGARGPRYVRTIPVDQARELHLAHREAQTRIAAMAAAKRAKADHAGDVGTITLAEIAHRYRGYAMPDARAGLLAMVIGYIQSGRIAERGED